MYIGQGIIRYCKLHRYFLLIEFFFSFLGQCFVHVSNICCLPHEYKIFTAFTRGMVAFIKWSCFHICIVKIQQRLCHHLLLFFCFTEQGTRRSCGKTKTPTAVINRGRPTHQECTVGEEEVSHFVPLHWLHCFSVR